MAGPRAHKASGPVIRPTPYLGCHDGTLIAGVVPGAQGCKTCQTSHPLTGSSHISTLTLLTWPRSVRGRVIWPEIQVWLGLGPSAAAGPPANPTGESHRRTDRAAGLQPEAAHALLVPPQVVGEFVAKRAGHLCPQQVGIVAESRSSVSRKITIRSWKKSGDLSPGTGRRRAGAGRCRT